MVVAVGFTGVEPPADVDVNVPGVMAMLVAPVVCQLSVLLEPEVMLVRSAVKEPMAGSNTVPEGELDEPQPSSPTQANRMSRIAQRSSLKDLIPRMLRVFLHNELIEFMRSPICCRRRPIQANTLRPSRRTESGRSEFVTVHQ